MDRMRPMSALIRHELRAGRAGIAGQAAIVAVAGAMMSLLFSVLRLSRADVGMPTNSRFIAMNAVLWIVAAGIVILPQVGRFGIDRRRYQYACWAIAGVSFPRTMAIIGVGAVLSVVAGMLAGIALATVAAPFLGSIPVTVGDAPLFPPGLSLAPAPSDHLAAFAVVAILILVSALVGAWRIVRTPPRLALADVSRESRPPLVRRLLALRQLWLVVALASIAFGWLVAGQQSGLFVAIAGVLLLVWAAGVIRDRWIRQVQRVVIGLFGRRPMAYGSSGLATESLRLDPIVLYPILFTMGVPAIVVSVVNAEGLALGSRSSMTLEDIGLLFFGPLVLALATAMVGLALGASALGRTMDLLGVFGLPRWAAIVSAGISQIYLAGLSLLLVAGASVIAAAIQTLIVGGNRLGNLLRTIVEAPPYGYLGAVFVLIALPAAGVSAGAHALRAEQQTAMSLRAR